MSRLFVLGAGFSAPAGLPLGNGLFQEIVKRCKTYRGLQLYDNIVKQDLNKFCNYKFVHTGKRPSIAEIDFEEFISFLDLEHHLRLKGSDIYSFEADRAQAAVKNMLALILWQKCQSITDEQLSLYVEFAKRLEPGDIVITFNYDTVLEMAFEKAKVRYSFAPRSSSAGLDKDIIYQKMHGSIDWFDLAPIRAKHNELVKIWKKAKAEIPQSLKHTIFGNKKHYKPRKIVPRPYKFKNSRLKDIYRVQKLDDFFERSNLVLESPALVSPSLNKILYMDPLIEYWWGANERGIYDNSLVFIGFSLPQHDDYLKHPLSIIARNYQEYEHPIPGEKKTPVRFVDLRRTDKQQRELMNNYSFLNWNTVDAWWGGLSMEALDFIFDD